MVFINLNDLAPTLSYGSILDLKYICIAIGIGFPSGRMTRNNIAAAHVLQGEKLHPKVHRPERKYQFKSFYYKNIYEFRVFIEIMGGFFRNIRNCLIKVCGGYWCSVPGL